MKLNDKNTSAEKTQSTPDRYALFPGKKVYNTDRSYDRYVFLDRDGVINRERGDYTTTVDEWQWAPGALEGIRRLTDAGYGIIVITNQSCITRGIQTEERLTALHDFMVETVRDHGGNILAVYHCPHSRDYGCSCRKPEPGMLIAAASDFNIDLSMTFFIGNAGRDMKAGRRAGVRTIFIENTPASDGIHDAIDADFYAGNLNEASDTVIKETL